MERFTVKITDDGTGKEFIHKFEQMKDAKAFSIKASGLKGNENISLVITDNKVNQRVYWLFQVDGLKVGNLFNSSSKSISSYFQD